MSAIYSKRIRLLPIWWYSFCSPPGGRIYPDPSVMNFAILHRFFLCSAIVISASLLCHCSSVEVASEYDAPAYRPTNPNNVRVKVSLNNRMCYVMEGNRALLVTPVAIGRPGKETPRGEFHLLQENREEALEHLRLSRQWFDHQTGQEFQYSTRLALCRLPDALLGGVQTCLRLSCRIRLANAAVCWLSPAPQERGTEIFCPGEHIDAGEHLLYPTRGHDARQRCAPSDRLRGSGSAGFLDDHLGSISAAQRSFVWGLSRRFVPPPSPWFPDPIHAGFPPIWLKLLQVSKSAESTCALPR